MYKEQKKELKKELRKLQKSFCKINEILSEDCGGVYSEVNKKFTEVWTFKEATCKMMDRPLMQVLQWVDYSEYCDCEKGDVEWTKQGFEFRDYYITLCYEDKRQPIQMGLYNPYDGKYY